VNFVGISATHRTGTPSFVSWSIDAFDVDDPPVTLTRTDTSQPALSSYRSNMRCISVGLVAQGNDRQRCAERSVDLWCTANYGL